MVSTVRRTVSTLDMGADMEHTFETGTVVRRSARAEERLDPARREARLTSLFRRWPALADEEQRELRRLWDERVRQAKQQD
jgi:hypothetical protein